MVEGIGFKVWALPGQPVLKKETGLVKPRVVGN